MIPGDLVIQRDQRIEDMRYARFEEMLSAQGAVLADQAKTLKDISAQMERIVRLEERSISRDTSVTALTAVVDHCTTRGESHASRLATVESQMVALTWFSRVVTAGIVGGFIAWLWSLKGVGAP